MSTKAQQIDDPLTYAIIGAAMLVRKAMGCGLLESAYHKYLCAALSKAALQFVSQPVLPAEFDGLIVPAAYRPDLIVNNAVVVEVKAVQEVLPIHKAQCLTYMRLSRIEKGLVLNFNAVPFSAGIVRLVLTPVVA